MSDTKIIETAEFNPNIKNYFLTSVSLVLLLTIIGIPFLIIWLLGLGQAVSKRYYDNLGCQLTEKHLEFKKGVLFRVEKTIPLENIQDLAFIENPLLKFFDMRLIKIETAGSSNPQGADMSLVGIVDAQEFKNKVIAQREKLVSSRANGPSQPQGQMENSDQGERIIELLTEVRDLLKK